MRYGENGMKIKSCPWCGNQPQVWNKTKHPSDIEFWYVACINESCRIMPALLGGYLSEKIALIMWNTRRE